MAKIDIGEDKNEIVPDKHPLSKSLSIFTDDLPKTQEDAVAEVRKNIWTHWINSEPLLSAHIEDDGRSSIFFINNDEIKNKIILLDICDFTLLPCRRSSRYVKEWYRRYSSAGLVVIGIHTPFYEFAKDRRIVEALLYAMDIQYPVVMDNDYLYWKAFDNRFWPRRVLIDSKGKTHADFVGEGAYPEFEKKMQDLLRALSPGLPCPPILKPMRDVDDETASAAQTTSEIFLGTKYKQRLGNKAVPLRPNEEFLFTDETSDSLIPDVPYFKGAWSLHSDHMEVYVPVDPKRAHKGEHSVTIQFTGTDVFLVAKTKSKILGDPTQSVKLNFLINGKPLAEENFGEDISYGDTYRPQLIVRDPRLFHAVSKLDYGTHRFTVIVDPEGPDTAEIYAFFFDSLTQS